MKPWLPLCALVLSTGILFAQPSAPVVPAGARPIDHFSAAAATQAWMDSIPAEARARSDAYFEGREWLMLWDFLAAAAILAVVTVSGVSARMRSWAEARFRPVWLQRTAYWVQFIVSVTLLDLPLTVYEGFIREREYGLMNQTFGGWFADQAIAFTLTFFFGWLGFLLFLTMLQRLPHTWHWWGVVVAMAFAVLSLALSPVFIDPLFNTYTSLPDSPIKRDILSLARANGIQARDVFEVNASKQSDRVSAFVMGLGATERIVLNDNLLRRISPEGVMSVMGHEMGHYVMHHILNTLLFLAILATVFFLLLRWILQSTLPRWGIRGLTDPAVLPWALLILLTLDFIATPLENSWTRTEEAEADMYGLNAARQPDGEAEVDLLLGEYRKLNPGPLEEFVFYDHPSGRARIYMAMRWKGENLCLFSQQLPCGGAAKGR